MVALIHFQPLELYPPVQNFIELWSRTGQPLLVICCGKETGVKKFTGGGNVQIKRITRLDDKASRLNRITRYAHFYLKALALLLKHKPGKILYYETISAFPALVFQQLYPKTELFVHYHEYTSEKEYKEGMVLVKNLHNMEKGRYAKMKWISHTNEQRLKLFADDARLHSSAANMHVVPNYPPQSWIRTAKKRSFQLPVQLVYVGAVNLDSMYFREVSEWITAKEGDVLLDIYTLNMDEQSGSFLVANPFITLLPGVSYDALPDKLNKYDAGLILYKGHIPNYVYNAPNKLFEYLACGIDVWVPAEMTGALPYVNTSNAPQVRTVDFKQLHTTDLQQLLTPGTGEVKTSPYYMEAAYTELFKALA